MRPVIKVHSKRELHRMKIVDRIYYFMYCLVTGGVTNPITELGGRKVPLHAYAYQLLLITSIFLFFDISKYSGIINLIDDNKTKLHIFLVIAFILAIALYFYLTKNGRDVNIVKYYSEIRAGSKKADALTGLSLVIGSLAMVFIYGWFKELWKMLF